MDSKNLKTIEIHEPSIIISKEEFEGLTETLEILADSKLVKEISEALSENKNDRINHKDLFGKK
jgi:PHD/YefM family antitoxin component YafN of YafNO toxin-antitoxin module